MITKFNNYILESRKSIDELEMLNPTELGELLIAEVCDSSPDIQYIKDLLAVGCPIDTRADDGCTPLHLAARRGNPRVIEFLVSKGAEVNARNNEGWTPLHLATNWGRLMAAIFLLSRGADIQARDEWGRTAWDNAPGEIKKVLTELNPHV